MVKGETTLDRVDLNQAVTATLALARSEFVARQTKVEFRREQPELAVMGNLAQLQQVVLNLILNAAEAMSHLPPQERLVEIETGIRKDGFRVLAVSDHGWGVSPEVAVNAFKPFFSTKANGLGFGLSICRSIAQAHRGTLMFDEDKRNGTRVILALPPA
ncbi:MAG: sensor histidine kinase [Alphaproteobacteria bacterium]